VRRVAAVLFLVGIGASYLLLCAPTDPIQNIVHQLHGERWYRIEQNGEHIGFMHNTVNKQTLTTRINYRAPDAPAVTIHQQLHFGSEAPFALQRAAYSQRIGEQYSAVSVKPNRVRWAAKTA
jgi:predicted dienelactone hydrolase